MGEQRLQKILAHAGVASRRESERIISAGRVKVDGQVVTELGAKADPDHQEILVDDQPVGRAEPLQFWILNKPAGVVSTVSDPEDRPKVVDLLPDYVKGRLYPVGRLDMYSEGLVLLTNDGALAQKMTHPRYKVPKRYKVWVEGKPSEDDIAKLRRGVEIDGGPSAPAQVFLKSHSKGLSLLRMVLYEGRKREIRQMCDAVGHPVKRLLRVGIGPLRLGDLPVGASRKLTIGEIKELRRGLR